MEYKYEVALSFAGEERSGVGPRQVADIAWNSSEMTP
jgi:hypothetical protein